MVVHQGRGRCTLQLKFDCKFPGCQLVGHQGDHFCFQVPKQSLRPYAIFGFLEGNNERLHIDEYGVSETSLEHIFNTMAAYKGDEQLHIDEYGVSETSLEHIFNTMAAYKGDEQLHINEYGVSETSLEHIFNTMAAYKGDEQLQGSARYRCA
ncbi:hypothetical protein DD238_007942 [Peronospora effusa]|uniref:ABCA1-4-like C-terminal R2 regulatory domain-containing protein n=2 Tax=Peronospora effusa TaxID=542832 RepID=A0A3M6V727_9STRA|nr:hypothetical protein DD238_007942 [Peronospora effusa]